MPGCRDSRRHGFDLEHKSKKRSLASKCKADTPPGQFGSRRSRVTDYGRMLMMKELIKSYYCVAEKPFHNYYLKAARKKTATGDLLLKTLESRLDNVVYRLGFGSTRAEARQLVSHKAILVNGKLVNIPSYLLLPGDKIEIREESRKQTRIKDSLVLAEQGELAAWLTLNAGDFNGIFDRHPEISELPPVFQIHLVVELYSK